MQKKQKCRNSEVTRNSILDRVIKEGLSDKVTFGLKIRIFQREEEQVSSFWDIGLRSIVIISGIHHKKQPGRGREGKVKPKSKKCLYTKVPCKSFVSGVLLDTYRCSINVCKISIVCNCTGQQWSAYSGTRALTL